MTKLLTHFILYPKHAVPNYLKHAVPIYHTMFGNLGHQENVQIKFI